MNKANPSKSQPSQLSQLSSALILNLGKLRLTSTAIVLRCVNQSSVPPTNLHEGFKFKKSCATDHVGKTLPEIIMEVDGTTCLVFGFHGHPWDQAMHVATRASLLVARAVELVARTLRT